MTRNISLDVSLCKGCYMCIEVCPKKALCRSEHINKKGYQTIAIDTDKCIRCGMCYRMCPDYVFTIIEV
ncbi:MAG: 4Fe-4S binding protein [Oscillospiraceae bacterium]